MTTFRISKRQNFTTVDNTHINDNQLSWKATAILTYLLSKPDNWVVHIKQLATAKKCGIKSVYAGMKELKALGYIEHEFIQGSDGKFIKGQYIVHEIPIEVKEVETKTKTRVPVSQKPHTQNGNTVKSNAVNSTLLNTDGTHYSVKQKTDYYPPAAKPPKTETKKTKSSSSSDNSNDQHNIDKLTSLLPKDKLTEEFTPQFKLLFVKALSKGFSIEYIALAITYTIDHSKGSIFEFKSYLGKTLDNNYHAGYVSKHEALRIKQEKQRQAEADRITRERLKAQKEREELEKIRIENESRQQALESLKALNPDRYREVQYQALDILERQRPTYRYDANGAFVKAQMSIILGL